MYIETTTLESMVEGFVLICGDQLGAVSGPEAVALCLQKRIVYQIGGVNESTLKQLRGKSSGLTPGHLLPAGARYGCWELSVDLAAVAFIQAVDRERCPAQQMQAHSKRHYFLKFNLCDTELHRLTMQHRFLAPNLNSGNTHEHNTYSLENGHSCSSFLLMTMMFCSIIGRK